jgi:hypothetical protein
MLTFGGTTLVILSLPPPHSSFSNITDSHFSFLAFCLYSTQLYRINIQQLASENDTLHTSTKVNCHSPCCCRGRRRHLFSDKNRYYFLNIPPFSFFFNYPRSIAIVYITNKPLDFVGSFYFCYF